MAATWRSKHSNKLHRQISEKKDEKKNDKKTGGAKVSARENIAGGVRLK